MEIDTDSYYMAISGKPLEDVVKPELREEYNAAKPLFFPRDDHLAYDNPTPGLFKLEKKGTKMCCLNSKTYYIEGDDSDKYSSKGLSKVNNNRTLTKYTNVLNTQKPYSGIAKGFKMMKDGHLNRIDMWRNGLTYFYGKREVLSDGVSTRTIAHV